MKKSSIFILAVLAAVLIGAFIYAKKETKNDVPVEVRIAEPETKEKEGAQITIAGENFKTDVANTEALRNKGLSGRKGLLPDEAMLFVFEKASPYAFWMKDMLFSIDIVWLNRDKEVIYVKNDVSPDTHPQGFAPASDALYVVELRAGTAKRLNIKQGDSIGISL